MKAINFIGLKLGGIRRKLNRDGDLPEYCTKILQKKLQKQTFLKVFRNVTIRTIKYNHMNYSHLTLTLIKYLSQTAELSLYSINCKMIQKKAL